MGGAKGQGALGGGEVNVHNEVIEKKNGKKEMTSQWILLSVLIEKIKLLLFTIAYMFNSNVHYV